MPSSQTLTGFVYDAAGKAVSSAEVRLYRAGTTTGALSSTVTNAAGKWTFALSSATDSNYDAGAVDLDVQITNAATGVVGRVKFEDQVQVERVVARQFLLSPDSNASSATAGRGFFHRLTGTTTLGAEMTHTLPKFTGTFLMGQSQDSAGAFVLDSAQTITSSAAATFTKLTTTSSLEVTGGGVKVNTNKFTTDSDGNTVVAGTFTVSSDGSAKNVVFYSATAGDNLTWDGTNKKLIITGTDGTDAFAVADGDATFADDVTISGDLTVSGTTTTINSTITTYSDVLVKLGQGATADPASTEVDLGFIFTRGNGSASNIANRAMLWDESADQFVFAFTNTEAGTTTGNVSINDYANLRVGAITADDASTFTSKITADAGIDIDNINIDGTTIALSSGDLTLDVAGDIVLDADGDDVSLQAGGSYPLTFTQSSSGNWVLKNTTSNMDFTIAGNDGGSNVNALVFDMSDAGKATFSGDVVVTGDVTISGDDLFMGTNTDAYMLIADGTNFNPVAISGDIAITNAGVTSIASGVIVTADLANDAVTAAKIADDAVVTAAIADDAITSALIADDQVTIAKMAGLTRGSVIYGDGSGNPAALAVGGAGTLLYSDGTDLSYSKAVYATDLTIGEDAQTKIDFETADEIHFDTNNVERVVIDNTGLTIKSGSLETATIDFTDGDLAMTIADGGGVTFAQAVALGSNTLTTTGSLQIQTIDYSDGDLAMTIADGGGTTFAQASTFTGGLTLNGDANLAAEKLIKIGGTAEAHDFSTEHSGHGITLTMEAGENLTLGQAVYVDSNGKAQHPDVDAASVTGKPAIGIAMTGASSGASVNVMVLGMFRDATYNFSPGAAVIMTGTDGALTTTAGDTAADGDIVQRVGIAITADMLFVMPSIDEIEHA